MAMGFFNDQEKEYVITDMYPKRNLLNYLWNDTTVCACDQFGFGTSWSVINGVRNLTIHNGERIIYIKDLDEGEYFSPNRNYKKQKFDVFECHVGIDYQKVVSEYKGIRVEFTTLVPSIGNEILFSVKVANPRRSADTINAAKSCRIWCCRKEICHTYKFIIFRRV